MPALVLALLPMVIGSAIVPIQLVITVLLLRSPGGRGTAAAWIAGMTAVRLLQGLVLGVLLGAAEDAAAGQGSDTGSLVEVIVLLVLAALFYTMAAKAWLKAPDEDAPPPRWMTLLEGVGPGRAFLLGAGVLAIAAKSWVFTLGAIGVIEEAGLDPAGAVVAFLAFVLLAQGIHLALLAIAVAVPARADAVLGRFSTGLERHQRTIVVTLGLAFGSWFLLGALGPLRAA